MAPVAVLDSNVVFDCLLFCDADTMLLRQWLESSRLRWMGSDAMRDELAHVLARGDLAPWKPDTAALLAARDRLCLTRPAGSPASLHCADVDDQKFIDFALTHRARWLISRDRAVLKLARRARMLSLAIVTPRDWTAEATILEGRVEP